MISSGYNVSSLKSRKKGKVRNRKQILIHIKKVVYLNSSFGEASFEGEPFSGGDAWVVRLLKLLLQFLQLFWGESCSIPAKFGNFPIAVRPTNCSAEGCILRVSTLNFN